MNDIEKMYDILEQMVENAELGKGDRVQTLNESYEALVPKVYPKLSEAVRQEYDNCRLSCVISFGMLKSKKEELILDAKQRFSIIPKPQG